jgi:flagellar hook-basal body complex protein FliE
MALPIVPIHGPTLPIQVPKLPTVAGGSDGLFRSMLEQSISTVDTQRAAAQQSVDRFLAGEGEELHQVAMATQKAELSFEMFLQVRNKVVQAYQEIMRMQI